MKPIFRLENGACLFHFPENKLLVHIRQGNNNKASVVAINRKGLFYNRETQEFDRTFDDPLSEMTLDARELALFLSDMGY